MKFSKTFITLFLLGLPVESFASMVRGEEGPIERQGIQRLLNPLSQENPVPQKRQKIPSTKPLDLTHEVISGRLGALYKQWTQQKLKGLRVRTKNKSIIQGLFNQTTKTKSLTIQDIDQKYDDIKQQIFSLDALEEDLAREKKTFKDTCELLADIKPNSNKNTTDNLKSYLQGLQTLHGKNSIDELRDYYRSQKEAYRQEKEQKGELLKVLSILSAKLYKQADLKKGNFVAYVQQQEPTYFKIKKYGPLVENTLSLFFPED